MSRALLIAAFLFIGIVYSTKAQFDFQSLKTIPQRGDGWEVVPSDLDGDGDMDIVFSTRDNPSLYALFNTNGEFQSTPVSITPEFYTEPNSIYELPFDASDFDNDGIDEIIYYSVTMEVSTKRISVLKYDGQSFITIATLNTPNANATSIATGDVNKDGKMDIIHISSEIYLLESSATGYVEKKIPTPQTIPYKLKISDIDGDTWPDLVIHDTSFKISIYKNNKNGAFDFNQHISATTSLIRAIQIADFNNDGFNDIVVAGNSDQHYIDLFTQVNSGIFQSSKLNMLSNHFYGLDVGDFNHDTKIDIVTGGFVSDPVSGFGINLLENTGTGFTPSFFSQPTLSPMDMKFADLDNDNNKEIVLMNFGKNIRLLDINSSQISPLKIIPFGNTFSNVFAKDLDNDGYDDLISSDPFSASITILRNKGNGEYEVPQYHITDGMPSGVAAGDFNNDGYSDIVYSSNYATPESSILLSNQDGTLNVPEGIGDAGTVGKIVTGDFNNDGNLDFYGGSNLAFGNGDGTFIIGSSNLNNIYEFETADFNNDGFTDLVAASGSGLSIAHGQNSYALTLVQNIATSKLVSSVTSGELTFDTYTDFLVIYNDGTVSLFANSSTETFIEIPITVQGISSKAVINDFDKDGLNDFAVLVGNKKVVLYTPSPGGTFKLLNTYPTDPWYYSKLLLLNQNGDSDLDILMLSNSGPIAILLNDLVKEPTLFPSNLNATEITDTSLTLTLDKGDGDGRIVVIREESTFSSFLPVDNQIYIPNAKFGAGSVSAGNYVVMADNSTEVTISGLKENSSYAITAFEYSSNENKTIVNYFIGALESITISTLKSQTITPLTIPNKLVSDVPFAFSATASSNLAVTIELISGGVTFTNGNISIQHAGPVKFKLTQPGNDEFAAATVEYTFCVNPLVPSISYTALQNNKFQLASSSTTNNKWLKNGLEITNANGQMLEVDPDGIYKVKVDYAGCSSTSASISNQTINFATIPSKEEGQADFQLIATASSSLAISYDLISGGVTLNNSTIKINTPGPAKIKATQAGNNSFFPASPVEQTFCVNPKVPTITTTSSGLGLFTLTSSSDINNQWLRNNVSISGAINKTYEPTEHGMYTVKVDYSGCSNSSLPTTFLILGIDENQHTISIYPNPASDKLYIEWPAQNPNIDNVLFHDSQGKQFIVNYAYREDLIAIDIHNLIPGLYTILLQTKNGSVVRKVIKN